MRNEPASAAVVAEVNGLRTVSPPQLTKTALAETGDFVVERVDCRCASTGWSPLEPAARYGIVFVSRGCFRRRVNGIDTFVDPTVVYFERPADEQQISHPGRGDSCTVLYLSDALLASVCGGELDLPDEPVPTDAARDLAHRLLLASISHGDNGEVEEAVVSLAAGVVESSEPDRVAVGRPATALARKRAAADAREVLNETPSVGVIALAHRIAVSPHHLSRVFKAETGETITRYRNRLRVRLALERLAEGEPCLTRLAAELGFADQAHLSRVVRRELGTTPSDLRARLTAA